MKAAATNNGQTADSRVSGSAGIGITRPPPQVPARLSAALYSDSPLPSQRGKRPPLPFIGSGSPKPRLSGRSAARCIPELQPACASARRSARPPRGEQLGSRWIPLFLSSVFSALGWMRRSTRNKFLLAVSARHLSAETDFVSGVGGGVFGGGGHFFVNISVNL